MSYDPNFSAVTALLHFEGADPSYVFTDVKGHTFAGINNAQIDGAQYKWGSGSGLFSTGDSISTPDHADFEFGAGDFTIELWVRQGATAATSIITIKRDTFTYAPFVIYASTAAVLFSSSSNGTSSWDIALNAAVGTLSLNTWHHIAITRSGTTIHGFLDGVEGAGFPITSSAALYDGTGHVCIGGLYSGSSPFFGWIDDFRITKGVARYTTNFTPPTGAFPDIGPDGFTIVATSTAAFTGSKRLQRALSVAGTSTVEGVGAVYVNPNGIAATLPKRTVAFSAMLGATSRLASRLPALRGALQGGRYAITSTLPAMRAAFSAVASSPASMQARLPLLRTAFTAQAANYARMAAALPVPSAAWIAGNGSIAALHATFPALSAAFSARAGITGAMAATLFVPVGAFTAYRQVSGALAARLPRLRVALAADIPSAQALVQVMNTITNAVVTYAQYPYNSFATYQGMYLAAGPSGLFRVDSGADDASVPIAANLATGELMFGSEFIKRISDFYAGMRSAGDMLITVTTDEGEAFDYILNPHEIALLKQRRSRIGKGLRGKYFKFSFSNIDGADFDFDTMNVAAVPTARRI